MKCASNKQKAKLSNAYIRCENEINLWEAKNMDGTAFDALVASVGMALRKATLDIYSSCKTNTQIQVAKNLLKNLLEGGTLTPITGNFPGPEWAPVPEDKCPKGERIYQNMRCFHILLRTDLEGNVKEIVDQNRWATNDRTYKGAVVLNPFVSTIMDKLNPIGYDYEKKIFPDGYMPKNLRVNVVDISFGEDRCVRIIDYADANGKIHKVDKYFDKNGNQMSKEDGQKKLKEITEAIAEENKKLIEKKEN